MKYSNERFHTGGFIMGDVYERNIDDESKKLIPAYVGVYDRERLLGYVTYYSDVDNTNWGMRLTENLSAQRQTGRSYTVMLCLAFVFFVLAIFIVQIFITKNVLAPIEQIMNVFNDIKATQDYSKRLPKSNSVEMNQLSDEINGLLTYIEDENIQEKERQRHLRELAECDPLTGINNKKAIEQKMQCMMLRLMERIHM